MSEIHQPGIPPCPHCGGTDQVASVPAVYRAGQRVVPVRVQDENGFSHTENRTVLTPPASALSPVPPPTWVGAGLLTVFLGFVLGIFGLGAFFAGGMVRTAAETGPMSATGQAVDHSYLWFFAVGTLLLAAAVAVFVVGGRHRRGLIRDYQARPARAERVWERAWYCARCGTVHFPPSPDLPPGALPIGEFRRIIRAAGGFDGEAPGPWYPVR